MPSPASPPSAQPETDDAIAALNDVILMISAPGAWTRDVSARDDAGRQVSPVSERACSWCLTGALLRATDGAGDPDTVYALAHEALRFALAYSPANAGIGASDKGNGGVFTALTEFNDKAPDVAHVLALAGDAVIALERAPEAVNAHADALTSRAAVKNGSCASRRSLAR